MHSTQFKGVNLLRSQHRVAAFVEVSVVVLHEIAQRPIAWTMGLLVVIELKAPSVFVPRQRDVGKEMMILTAHIILFDAKRIIVRVDILVSQPGINIQMAYGHGVFHKTSYVVFLDIGLRIVHILLKVAVVTRRLRV